MDTEIDCALFRLWSFCIATLIVQKDGALCEKRPRTRLTRIFHSIFLVICLVFGNPVARLKVLRIWSTKFKSICFRAYDALFWKR